MDDSIHEDKIEPNTDQTDSPDDIELERDSEFTQRQTKDVVSDLRTKLKKAEEEKREYLLGWQRTKADYINSKKQDEEGNKLFVKFAEVNLISDLIPILDSFDAAIAEQAKKTDLPEEWKKGVQNVQNLLLKALKDHNLEIIDPLNQDFDPRIAEAVGMVTVDTPDLEGKVVSVFQKGYKVYDKVIRPAKVQVGKHG